MDIGGDDGEDVGGDVGGVVVGRPGGVASGERVQCLGDGEFYRFLLLLSIQVARASVCSLEVSLGSAQLRNLDCAR